MKKVARVAGGVSVLFPVETSKPFLHGGWWKVMILFSAGGEDGG